MHILSITGVKMDVYILLSHEWTYGNIYGQNDDSVLYYQYSDCFTLDGFNKFCNNNRLTYKESQGKLYDYGNIEKYEVIVKTLDK
jgi:hypothetical protein